MRVRSPAVGTTVSVQATHVEGAPSQIGEPHVALDGYGSGLTPVLPYVPAGDRPSRSVTKLSVFRQPPAVGTPFRIDGTRMPGARADLHKPLVRIDPRRHGMIDETPIAQLPDASVAPTIGHAVRIQCTGMTGS